MSALRVGRHSVRFLHSYPRARVSYAVSPHSLQHSAALQFPLSQSLYAIVRSYADQPVGRPKQHTGRAPARKTKTTSTTKKAAPKKNSVPSPKTRKPKPKPVKKPVKKVLTPEQLERQKNRADLDKVRELKRKAMKKEVPRAGLTTAYTVLQAEYLRSNKTHNRAEFTAAAKTIAETYKNLSASEREHYNHVANQNKVAAQEALQKWVTSLPATKIKEANDARKALTRMGVSGYQSRIPDSRTVKQPITPYLYFNIERQATGDFKTIPVGQAAKLIAGEWKTLPAGEKKVCRFQSP